SNKYKPLHHLAWQWCEKQTMCGALLSPLARSIRITVSYWGHHISPAPHSMASGTPEDV
ncbi:unnamed protein product, partial [Amoebophrya sp. A25]